MQPLAKPHDDQDHVSAPRFSWFSSSDAVLEPHDEEPETRPAWINSFTGEVVCIGLILLNAIVLCIDIEISNHSANHDSGPGLFTIQFLFTLLFVGEVVLRVMADGCRRYFNPIRNPSGVFDFVIVIACVLGILIYAFGGADWPAMSALRVLRLFRVIRLVRVSPDLWRLVLSLAASMRAVFWVGCLLVVLMFMGALICTNELGRSEDPRLRDYFGGVGASFYTHFMMLTLEGFPAVAEAAGAESWFWYVYIVGFILISSVVLLNLVTAIVVENVFSSSAEEEKRARVYDLEKARFQEVLEQLCDLAGVPVKMDLKEAEFKVFLETASIREALNTFGICVEVDSNILFQILDEDGNGRLSFYEIKEGLLRLRGTRGDFHSLIVQDDLIKGKRRIEEALYSGDRSLEFRISQHASKACSVLETKLSRYFSQLHDLLVWGTREAPQKGAQEGNASPETNGLAVRIQGLVETVEAQSEKASAALTDLRRELSTSRGRVQELEARLRRLRKQPGRNREIQTDPIPGRRRADSVLGPPLESPALAIIESPPSSPHAATESPPPSPPQPETVHNRSVASVETPGSSTWQQAKRAFGCWPTHGQLSQPPSSCHSRVMQEDELARHSEELPLVLASQLENRANHLKLASAHNRGINHVQTTSPQADGIITLPSIAADDSSRISAASSSPADSLTTSPPRHFVVSVGERAQNLQLLAEFPAQRPEHLERVPEEPDKDWEEAVAASDVAGAARRLEELHGSVVVERLRAKVTSRELLVGLQATCRCIPVEPGLPGLSVAFRDAFLPCFRFLMARWAPVLEEPVEHGISVRIFSSFVVQVELTVFVETSLSRQQGWSEPPWSSRELRSVSPGSTLGPSSPTPKIAERLRTLGARIRLADLEASVQDDSSDEAEPNEGPPQRSASRADAVATAERWRATRHGKAEQRRLQNRSLPVTGRSRAERAELHGALSQTLP